MDFWERLKRWDVIVMLETWMEEKGWEVWKRRLPRDYEWDAQPALKRNKKGRAKGGIIIGVRKEVRIQGEKMKQRGEGIVEWRIKIGKKTWVIGGVYVREGMKEKMEGLREWMEEGGREEIYRIIGGDFNARTGTEGEGWRVEIKEADEEFNMKRKTKDNKINREGRWLLKAMEGTGWGILNGTIEGDEEGEITYTGARGSTVIDYILADSITREKIKRLKIGEEIDSDHHPLTIDVEEEEGRRKRGGRGEGRKEEILWRGRWEEERKENFRSEIGKLGTKKGWNQLERKETLEKIKSILRKWGKEEKRENKNLRGWWDKECREGKKQARKELRRWKRGEIDEKEYKRKKKMYKELCERKKREEQRKLEIKIRGIKTEKGVWEIINRERKESKERNEGSTLWNYWEG